MGFFGVILGIKNAQFNRGIDESRRAVGRFKADAQGAFSGFGKFLAGLGAASALSAFGRSLVERADQLQDLSEKFGVSTDALQKLGNVAEQNGSSLEGVASALNKLAINSSKALGGDEKLQASFAELGVSMEDLRSLSPEQIMEKIGQSSMRAAPLVAVLGKNALELRNTLAKFNAGEGGGIMSAEDVARLAQLKDDAMSIWRIFQGWGATLAGPVAGALLNLMGTLQAQAVFMKTLLSGGGLDAAAAAGIESMKQFLQSREKKGAPGLGDAEDDARKYQRLSAYGHRGQAIAEAGRRRSEAFDELSRREEDERMAAELARVSGTGMEIANSRRDRNRAARDQARADRAFGRKYGEERLKEMQERRDPGKMIERAFEKAVQEANRKLEDKLSEINTTLEDRLDMPT